MSQIPPQSPKPLRGAWLVVALLFPVALLNYLDRQMIASMKSSVVADIPMDFSHQEQLDERAKAAATTDANEVKQAKPESFVNTNWGHMLGQFKWVYAIFSPIGGLLADRFSRRFTICASLAIWSVITFATGNVTTYEGLLWTRTMMGISEAFYIPAALALIADYHIGSTRSKAVGVHQMGIYCGVLLGGFTGYAADSPQIGWRWAFKWIGLFGIIYAVPLLLMLRDVGKQSSDAMKRAKLPIHLTLWTLIGNVSFLALVLYFTLPAMAGWVIRDWMPSLLKDAFPEIGQGLAGVSATIWQVAAIFAAIVGGVLADRWMKHSQRGRIYISAIGMSLLIPALVFVGRATSEGGSMTMAVLALVLFGIGWGFFDCNNMPILCQIVRPEFRATGYGLMNFVSISCGGFADKMFGALRDHEVPMKTIFGLFALVCVVSVAIVLLIQPRLTDEQQADSW